MPSPDKFIQTLTDYKLDQAIVAEVSDGYSGISCKSDKKTKAAYFTRAVRIMREKAGDDKTKEIFEANACCKGGSREKASKLFAKTNASLSLEERLKKIPEEKYMGIPVMNEDGSITLTQYATTNGVDFSCVCPTYNKVKRDYPVDRTYCYCCAGHFKHHYEIMLGVKLKTLEIVASPLDSDGKSPCTIRYGIAE